MIDKRLLSIPNALSIARLLLLLPLWYLAIEGLSIALAVGLLIAVLTDILDGTLARKLDLVSEIGSKLDSLADNLMKPSVVAWLFILEPDLYPNHSLALKIALVFYFTSLIIGLIKFRRFGNLHLYSGKVGSVFQYLFVFTTLLFPGYNRSLFYLAVMTFTITYLEALLIQLTRSEVNEHIGSILLNWLKPSF